jgi:ferredoxin-NADP reductase
LRCAEPFTFEPGQYCTLGVAGVERPYSIVSSPREPLLELFVELIPPPLGSLTPLLHALSVGATVTLRPRAKGVFLLRPEFRNHVMVSTVTGVAPFVSMLRYWLESPADDKRMYVLEGASFLDEFGYDDELRALAARNPKVRFVPTCSRPDDPRNAGWKGQVDACTRSSSIMSASGRSSRPKLASTPAAPRHDRRSARPLHGNRLHVRGRALLESVDVRFESSALQFGFESGSIAWSCLRSATRRVARF